MRQLPVAIPFAEKSWSPHHKAQQHTRSPMRESASRRGGAGFCSLRQAYLCDAIGSSWYRPRNSRGNSRSQLCPNRAALRASDGGAQTEVRCFGTTRCSKSKRNRLKSTTGGQIDRRGPCPLFVRPAGQSCPISTYRGRTRTKPRNGSKYWDLRQLQEKTGGAGRNRTDA